ncbi:MAG: uracil-DNA glycosylase [Candidatus Omnitrophota bacterium]
MGDKGFTVKNLRSTINSLKKRIDFESWFSPDMLETDKKNADIAPDMPTLYAQVQNCCLCELSSTRTKVVFGEGNPKAEIVFIGEAPGRDEDISGRPFVGAAGQLLTKIIQAMGFTREDVFISNILKCRPPNNRNPLPEEIIQCKPYLRQLLRIIKPKVICTLGKVATLALLEQNCPISKLRGNFYDFQGITVMPTFHPAYLLRNPSDKKLVWHDMKKIMEFLKHKS